MALGEGSRKIGEPCWSHVQCRRSQKNSYCKHLVCKCDSEFHNIDGKCSRNYWEDLGLQNWQLMVIALVTTLFFLAVFVGCVYYVLIKVVRRYRRTRPSGGLTAEESFKSGGGKRNSLTGEAVSGVKPAEMRHSIRSKLQRVERARTQLRREMDILKEKEKEEEEDEETTSGTSTEMEDDIVPATSVRPLTKFILPLHYSHSQAGFGAKGVGQQRNLRRSTSFGSWSLSSWEMEPLEAGLDWWPERKQFRRPIHRGEQTKTLRPLLLNASASESEEELA